MINISKKILAVAALATFSMNAAADIYNHGNHNDPSYQYSLGTINTIDCGNSSLASCINQANLEAFAKGRCESIKNVGGITAYGDPYWHSVQSFGVRPVSAVDGNNGTGTFDYSVDVIFSCSGLLHPGIRYNPSEF